MAGSGSADPQELMALATNPAGLAALPESIDAGLAFFNPTRSYKTSPSQANGGCSPQGCAFTIGPNNIGSENQLFPIPFIGMNWRLDDQNAIAAAFYARGGMNTQWQGGTATFDPDGGQGPARPDDLPGHLRWRRCGRRPDAGIPQLHLRVEDGGRPVCTRRVGDFRDAELPGARCRTCSRRTRRPSPSRTCRPACRRCRNICPAMAMTCPTAMAPRSAASGTSTRCSASRPPTPARYRCRISTITRTSSPRTVASTSRRRPRSA